MKKVYFVEYSCWDESYICGVYTTREYAQEYIDEIVEKDKGKLGCSEMQIRSRYDIIEEDLIR